MMKDSVFEIEYAGHILRYSFRYPITRYRFSPIPKTSYSCEIEMLATQEQIEKTRSLLSPDAADSFVEFRTLIEPTARSLLQYDCCIFHGVSFLWKDMAYLLTDPPGTGKTTHSLNWQRLFPDEITMICGDMPAIERREDGTTWIHPTSWNGKEKLGNRLSGPAAGIVLLEQGDRNCIVSLDPKDVILPLFSQFLVRPEKEEQICALARLMDQMLMNIPCFKFVNRGDDDSTRILRKTLFGCLRDKTGGENGTV